MRGVIALILALILSALTVSAALTSSACGSTITEGTSYTVRVNNPGVYAVGIDYDDGSGYDLHQSKTNDDDHTFTVIAPSGLSNTWMTEAYKTTSGSAWTYGENCQIDYQAAEPNYDPTITFWVSDNYVDVGEEFILNFFATDNNGLDRLELTGAGISGTHTETCGGENACPVGCPNIGCPCYPFNVPVTLGTPGNYAYALKVLDVNGNFDTDYEYVTVVEPAVAPVITHRCQA